MAEPIVRTFEIDTSKSEQNLRQLGSAFDSADNAGKSLKAQLRELQAQLANTDPQTKKYQELSAAAGELKDKISDAAQAVGTQAGGAFEKVSGSLGLVTSRIANLDFEGAAEGAKLLAKNITEIKPGDIANGVKGIGSAFASIGKALLTNPIFLIGAAIAGAIVYAEELLSLVDGITDAEQESLDIQKERAAQSKQQLDNISQQENLLRLQGRSEREILELKVAAANQAILEQKAVITTLEVQRQAQIDAAERNRKITSGIIQFLTLPIQVLLGTVDSITKGLNAIGVISDETFANIGNQRDKFNTSLSTLVFDPAEVAEEGNAAIEEQKKILQQLENTQAGFQLSIQAIDKKAADDRKNAADKQAADAKTKRDQDAKEYADAEKAKTDALELEIKKREQATQTYYEKLAALQDANFEATLTEQEKEELALTQKYEDLFAAADAAGIGTKELQDQLGLELLGIQQKYDTASVEQTEVTEEQKQALQLETVQKGLEWASKGIDALTNLSDIYFAGRLASVKKGSKEEEALAKKQFNFNKKLQLAGAIIDAGKAITMSLSQSPVAIGPVPNPAGIASLAFVSLASAANIAKIASTKFEGGGSAPDTPLPSIGGGGGDNGAQPAQFNPLAAQFVNNRPDQYLPRAYVLAGDVASQQEVRENVADLARVG